ncbi:MAG: Dipeptidyl aminopeptidase 4 [Phycisphaerales bacterium]|nr:Dipeptidyl aminopeptidase 4 [Phycisphaerales bacterium]
MHRPTARFLTSAIAAAALAHAVLTPAPALGRQQAPTTADPAAQPPESFLTQWALTRGFSLGRPRGVTVTPQGDAVLFLRSEPRSVVHSLYTYDLATGTEKVLLTAEKLLGGRDEVLTPEEKARRERMRQTSRGIVTYSLSEDGSKILVPLGSNLFLYDRATDKVSQVPVANGPVVDPRLSEPGNWIGYVKGDNLWAMPLAERLEVQLSFAADDLRTCGTSEFVAQEEMGRFEGYWFSPDETHIAYQITDHTGVERLTISDPMRPENGAQSPFYPRAGKTNATVTLVVQQLTGRKQETVKWNRDEFPYLATVRWSKNAPLTILVQNREQTRQQLLAVDHLTGKTTLLLEENDDAWLNIDQAVPAWLEDGSGFLWISDRSGEARLELRAADGSLVREVSPTGFGLRGLISLDSKNRVAYVSASAEPTESHVWRVPLDAAGTAQQLTKGAGLFGAAFGKDHSAYVLTSNTLEGEISAVVRRADGSTVGTLQSVAEKPPMVPQYELVTLGGPHHFRASIVRPRDFDPAKKYPVLLNVYGGPTAQTVTATRQGQLLKQWYADHGFIVVTADNRGTPGRDRAWEKITKNNFIDIPLDDQVAALEQLGRKFPEMDMSRVGVWGWSFGGYFTAMATMRRPDVFKCGVAGAPVCDFADYDTHYTERYLGLPDKNPKGYEACNVLTYCKDLSVPLMIVHGTADDNVYFMHALKMADALFKAGRPFEFLPLSGFTHMVPDPVVKERLESRIAGFFQKHLGSPSAR